MFDYQSGRRRAKTDWLSEVAKALVVKLAADAIEEAIKKASKPKRDAKHLKGEEAEM